MRIHFRESPVDKIRPNRIVPERLQITAHGHTGEGLSKPHCGPHLHSRRSAHQRAPLWGKCEHYQRTVN